MLYHVIYLKFKNIWFIQKYKIEWKKISETRNIEINEEIILAIKEDKKNNNNSSNDKNNHNNNDNNKNSNYKPN